MDYPFIYPCVYQPTNPSNQFSRPTTCSRPRPWSFSFCNIRVVNNVTTPPTDCGENKALSRGVGGGGGLGRASHARRSRALSSSAISDAAFGIGRSLLRGGALDPRARLLLDVLDQLVVRGGARVGEVPGTGVGVRGQGG